MRPDQRVEMLEMMSKIARQCHQPAHHREAAFAACKMRTGQQLQGFAGADQRAVGEIEAMLDRRNLGAAPRCQPNQVESQTFAQQFDPALLCSPPASTRRSEEHTSELQSLMRISYAVFCLKKKKTPY